jgi:hypothetical protein
MLGGRGRNESSPKLLLSACPMSPIASLQALASASSRTWHPGPYYTMSALGKIKTPLSNWVVLPFFFPMSMTIVIVLSCFIVLLSTSLPVGHSALICADSAG